MSNTFCSCSIAITLTINIGIMSTRQRSALTLQPRCSQVSADPKLKDDCFRGARFLARLLESVGAEVKVEQGREGKNPVVMGRLGHAADKPTITFYGHYDIQPALESDWHTCPFEMTTIDGYL